jgi:hypothetical protein
MNNEQKDQDEKDNESSKDDLFKESEMITLDDGESNK